MKKPIILLGMALGYTCITTPTYGLIYKKDSCRRSSCSTGSIKFGVSGGEVISRFKHIKTDNNTTIQPHWGLHAQAFGAYPLNTYLDIVAAIGYHAKGNILKHEISVAGNNFNVKRKLNFDYLQTSTQLNIFPVKARHFFLVTGGYLGYLLAAKEYQDTYADNQQQGDTATTDIKKETGNQLNKWDLGVALGLGYEFKGGIIFKIITDMGIRKIYDTDADSPGRNLTGLLSIGYNFGKLLK